MTGQQSFGFSTPLAERTANTVATRDATTWAFPLLIQARGVIQARGEIRRQLYQALLTLGEPKAILDIALSAYEKYGNEDRLTLAASLLMDLGAHAFPSLRILARSKRPECAWFVPTMAGLPDVKLQNRVEILIYLVKNPHSAVRQSLLGATQALPSPEAISLLHRLSQDPDAETGGFFEWVDDCVDMVWHHSRSDEEQTSPVPELQRLRDAVFGPV